MKERSVDVAVVGAGTTGLVALSEIRRVTDSFVLIDPGPLGTTCARVGCMPSKALIHIAEDFHRRRVFEGEGIRGGEGLRVDGEAVMRRVRELRDGFAGGMVRKTERFGERLIRAKARFVEEGVIEAGDVLVRAKAVVVGTGSHPFVPKEWEALGAGMLTSDTIFELEGLPKSMAVFGLGVIGCELGQAFARLGVEVVGISRSMRLGGAHDPEIVEAAAEALGKEMTLWRGEAGSVERGDEGFRVRAGSHSREVEVVLVAMGRRPNVEGLGLERLGVRLDGRGVPEFDGKTLQVRGTRVFIGGDVHGEWPIMHEAWDDGRVAGYNAVREDPACFARRTRLAITFTAPQIARAGLSWDDVAGGEVAVVSVGMESQGRAMMMGEAEGRFRIYADRRNGRVLGAEFCAPRAEHLAHLLAWAIQGGATVYDLLKMPFYHPTLEEAVRGGLQELARDLPHGEGSLGMTFCHESAPDGMS